MSALRNKVQSFWHKGPLSQWEHMCLASFARHGYDVDLYSYDPEVEVPAGVTRQDAAGVLPESEVFFYQSAGTVGKVSAFTNLFRYVLLHDRGGWWIDTDVVCLRPLPEPAEFTIGLQEHQMVNGAVMFAAPGMRIMHDAAKQCRALGSNVRWGQGGPGLLSRLVEKHRSAASVLPVNFFYPIHWSQVVEMLLLPERAKEAHERCAGAVSLHLYNEILARAGVRKSLLPPSGSFLHEMFVERGYGAAFSDEMAASEIRALVSEVEAGKRNGAGDRRGARSAGAAGRTSL